MEPRYQLDKDSICYGCQHYKAVDDCGEEPYADDVQYGGACDCKEPCFAGNQNTKNVAETACIMMGNWGAAYSFAMKEKPKRMKTAIAVDGNVNEI